MARIARKTKRIMCILVCCVLVMAHLGTSRKLRAEAMPEVASGATTIADIVLTYYSTVGAGISNVEFINKLSQDLGTNFGTIESFAEQGMLLQNDTTGAWEPVSELVTAIENTSAYQSLGLDQIFNVSAQEAAAGGGLAASGAATLAGAAGGVASIGMLPLFAGVTASYWAGIGAGTLITHLTQKYAPNIYIGVDMNTPVNADIISNAYDGGVNGYHLINGVYWWFLGENGICLTGYKYGDYEQLQFGNYSNSSKSYKVIRSDQTNISTNVLASGGSLNNFSSTGKKNPEFNWKNIKSTLSEANAYFSNLKNGTIQYNNDNYSPDMIGEDGNLSGRKENGNITVPDFKPQIDPGTEAAKPISVQDWLNFANSVKNNNSQVDPLPDNARLFQDLIDALKIGLPSPGPNPNPNPNPDPNPNPNPTPVPDPDYGDPNPDQPDWEDPTEVPDPVDTGNPWRLPDLSKKFPFCIPWDIGKMFGKLKVNSREAPHIQWRFNPPGTPVDYTFDLDLEDYEEVASLLRSLELIAFIVGLAFATRYLIGAT